MLACCRYRQNFRDRADTITCTACSHALSDAFSPPSVSLLKQLHGHVGNSGGLFTPIAPRPRPGLVEASWVI